MYKIVRHASGVVYVPTAKFYKKQKEEHEKRRMKRCQNLTQKK